MKLSNNLNSNSNSKKLNIKTKSSNTILSGNTTCNSYTTSISSDSIATNTVTNTLPYITYYNSFNDNNINITDSSNVYIKNTGIYSNNYYTTIDINHYYDDIIKTYLKENPEKLQQIITELRKEKLQQLNNDDKK